MARLSQSLRALGTSEFEANLKAEIAALGPDVLGLQEGLTTGSTALADDVGVMILRVTETGSTMRIRAGIFYTSILSGCACADDPTPENKNAEYCEIELQVDRVTGETNVALPTRK